MAFIVYNIRPSFGPPGGSNQTCSGCRKNGYICLYLKHKCKGKNCDTFPSYNFPKTKPPIYCKGCSLPGIVDSIIVSSWKS
jgi:hypothetical protein